MRELLDMWRYTKMVVLVGLAAGLYAAVLIPFKPITIIPGFTEIRPAAVLPVVFSLLFGPAAAWGSAFGNIIGDFFGTLGLGSIFGAIGNFLYGYIPYRLWRRLSAGQPVIRSGRGLLVYLLAVIPACIACGVFIGWGVDLLGLVPFAALANIILVNNLLVSLILGPILLSVLVPRVKRWGLAYGDIMEMEPVSSVRLGGVGHLLLWLGVIGGLAVGNALSFSLLPGLLKGAVGVGVAPFIALIIIGAFLV
ncbi:MAG TPA: QueT transporter family protein [Candidatus Latescibacteria bacterium]|nr:QueT transporter family protein [Candidatus Latescibacterota bacterium]